MTFTLRDPISENPHLRNTAAVLSRHSSLRSAERALLKHKRGTEQLGYHCEAYIWDEEHNCLASDSNLDQAGD